MSDLSITRREWLGAAAAGAALAMAGGAAAAEGDAAKPLKLKKAVKIGMIGGEVKDKPLVEKFALLKKIGYDGVELDSPSGLKADEVRAAIDKTGLPVHGVVDS